MFDKEERQIATALVGRILAANHTISVYDSEEYAIKRSRDKQAILNSLASTDQDVLIVRRPNGSRVGAILLIWGNGGALISDYTDNTEIRTLVGF